jgi:putative colanic acid biosynthesis UDP-glucose lipid carrier transferase
VITVSSQASLASRAGFATSGGRFKDFEMSRPFKIKQSVLIALFDAAQTALAPGVAVGVLYAALLAFGGAFDLASPTLIIMALLSWLLFRPSQKRGSALIPALVSVIANVVLRWSLLLSFLWMIGKLDLASADVYGENVRVTWSVATPLVLLLASFALQTLRYRFLTRATHTRSAVIAGYGSAGLKLARRLKRDRSMRLEVAGFFDDRSDSLHGIEPDVNILGSLSDLGAYVKQHRTDLIFVALPNREVQGVTELLDDLLDTTASIYYVPDSLEFDHIQARSEQVQGIPVVAMSESPLYGFSGVNKRLTDLSLALFVLAMLQPLFLLVAATVKLCFAGPVFYRERRYGLDGREITVYKFRTAPANGQAVTPRQRRVGEILRHMSLDALPMLFNVLQGKLSLVGPQPHLVGHSEEYRKLVKGYMVRHKMLPGITGLAQVNRRRAAARPQDLQTNVDFDLNYLRHWSPLLDLKIMALTVLNLFRTDTAH